MQIIIYLFRTKKNAAQQQNHPHHLSRNWTKEPSKSNSASLWSDLSSTTFQKSRDDYSTTSNKANQLRSIFIIDNSRTKPSINPRFASIQQSDHVTTQFMDKEHNLLGNQRCAHQLSLLRNIQQRASSDNTKKKSANEPTMKDKYTSFSLLA